jgi:hypothetical protein
MGVIGVGQITLFDQNDSPQALLSNEAHPVPSNADGSSPNLSGAISTFLILLAGVDITNLYTVTASPSSGITGTLSTYTYTVLGMTSDTGYVDFTATRSGYATITKRFSLSKMKQGLTGNPGASGQDAPRCLGLFACSSMASITGMISSDLAVLYSSDSNRGIYQYSGSTWSKLSSPTKDQVTRCFIYILDAVRQGYGTSTDYAIGSISFETILANFLFVSQVVLAASGWMKSANYAEASGIPTAGFMLDALNQVIKAYGAVFVNADVAGKITASSGSITGNLSLTGSLLGSNIYLDGSTLYIFSGSSYSNPAVNDTMIKIYKYNQIVFYTCTIAGTWSNSAVIRANNPSSYGFELNITSGGNSTTWSFMGSGEITSQSRYQEVLAPTSLTNTVGETAFSTSGAALPARGTWFVFKAYGGNDMGFFSGGSSPYTNYQAIRVK